MALSGSPGAWGIGPIGRRLQLERAMDNTENNRPAIIRLPAWIKRGHALGSALGVNKTKNMGETQEVGYQQHHKDENHGANNCTCRTGTSRQLIHGISNFRQLCIGKAVHSFLSFGSINTMLNHDLLHILTTKKSGNPLPIRLLLLHSEHGTSIDHLCHSSLHGKIKQNKGNN
jgi:hypothetical protein